MKRGIAFVLLVITLVCSACHRSPNPYGPQSSIIHTVKYQGETFSLISLWYTGSADNWREIARRNPKLNPAKLVKGTIVYVPQKLAIRATSFDASFVQKIVKSNAVARAQASGTKKPVRTDSAPVAQTEQPSPTTQTNQQGASQPSAQLVSSGPTSQSSDTKYRKKRAEVLDELLQ